MKNPLKFYNKKLPCLDEIVMMRYDEIAENCVYVTLLEYNLKGIIIFKELSKRRLRKRNLRQAAPIGKFAPAIVCEEPDEDSNISLTRKRLTDDEVRDFSEKYKKNRKIISIMENMGYFFKKDIQEMFNLIIHPLSSEYIEDNEDYDTIYDFFEDQYNDFSYLDSLDINDEISEKFKELILKNFAKAEEKIQMKMAIVSNTLEGINITKEILCKYEKENSDINFYLDKAPYYIMEKMSNDIKNDSKRFNTICEEIGKFILSKKGNFKLIK